MTGSVAAGEKLTAAKLGVPPWTAMTLLHGWVNIGGGYAAAQYRKWVLYNSVECIGHISSGTLTDGTIIATLPGGFTPASLQQKPIAAAGTALIAGSIPRIQIDASGNLEIFSVPTGSPTLDFHFWFSLDA